MNTNSKCNCIHHINILYLDFVLNINFRDDQRKNVVKNVDMSSLRVP